MTHTMTYSLIAQEPAPQNAPQPLGPANPVFIMAIGILFLVVVIMPMMNRKQKRELETLHASIKRGAKVVTNAMIVGVVVSAKDGEDEIVIKSEDSRLRVKRSAVIQVVGTDEAETAAK